MTVSMPSDGPPLEHGEYRDLSGVSRAMRRLFFVLYRMEQSLAPVLIQGEAGVGKESVAHAIHRGSRASGGAFRVFGCRSVAEDRMASELFGSMARDHKAAYEAAKGGTLYVADIDHMPLAIQSMLLRALDARDPRANGDGAARVRLIAGTQVSLEQRVVDGRFDRALYEKIASASIRIPALRERPEDVAPLAARLAARSGFGEVPPALVAVLEHAALPENGDEVQRLLDAYFAAAPERAPEDPSRASLKTALAEVIDLDRPFLEQREDVLELYTELYLDALLARTRGNQTAAAQVAGLDRTYLGRMLAKLGKRRPRARLGAPPSGPDRDEN